MEKGYLNLDMFQAPNRCLTVNSRYLELDGEPWLPTMGEFHYSRYPADEWETELRKMRMGGVDIVASYVFWNHHEEIEGRFRWDEQRDLRRFVSLVQKAGMYFYLRPGPWVHGEARNGGFPDWVLTDSPLQRDDSPTYREVQARFFDDMMWNGAVRCNDPLYLKRVTSFYDQIGAQLKGLMWEDGGPVVGVQLENEYHRRGPGCGAEHISELKRIAIEAGLRTPIYTVTGWPTLDFPRREVVPVSGAYPDGFWQGNHAPLPPSGVFVFNTERAIGEMGNVGGTPADGPINKEHYPFFLAEAGGGMHVSYHRRPVVSMDDLAATALVQIGSGANLYGYFMYHGGTNPVGQQGYFNETQDTGYPNDVGLLGYDFHAPLGQYGQWQPSWGRLRTLHSFVAAFGRELAPMEAVLADGATANAEDLRRLRVALRGAGDEAYIFINNHVRHYAMPDFESVKIEVRGERDTVTLPETRIPRGAYCIWPVGHRIGAAFMHYATVQPLTRWAEDGSSTWVAFSLPHQLPTLSFASASVKHIKTSSGQLAREGDALVLTLKGDRPVQNVELIDAADQAHRLIVLTQTEADRACRVHFSGRDRLVLCSHGLHQEGPDSEALVVTAPNSEDAGLRIYPADDLSRAPDAEGFARWDFPANAQSHTVPFQVLSEQREAAPIQLGPIVSWRGGPVPLMPDDEAFVEATRVIVTLPEALENHDDRILLEVDFVGDMARLCADGELVDDRIYDGEPWFIGIDRFRREGRWPVLEFRVLAAPEALPVFMEAAARSKLEAAAHRGEIREIRAHLWQRHVVTKSAQ